MALSSVSVCSGASASFATSVSGSGPFSFVWRKDGVILGGQTGNSLTLPSVTVGDGGNYCVEVAGPCNRVTNCAALTVSGTTTSTGFSDQTVCQAGNVTFSTVSSGAGPFGYVWRKDGAALTGATNSSLTINTASGTDTGGYCVEVSGACNS